MAETGSREAGSSAASARHFIFMEHLQEIHGTPSEKFAGNDKYGSGSLVAREGQVAV
jgi:hypothetical protein